MGELEALFDKGTGGKCSKWRHYFDIYERYISAFRNMPCVYLEIGVFNGGSLDIMRQYLGNAARIIGVDIMPQCKAIEQRGFEIYIGDQADGAFLRQLGATVGNADIIVDDGGHTSDQQITTFLHMFPLLRDGGIYIVEDLHANFWQSHNVSRYGITFFDFAKGLADKMSYWHLDPASLAGRYALPREQRPPMTIQNFATTQIYGMHFYDSIIVFEKRRVPEPIVEQR